MRAHAVFVRQQSSGMLRAAAAAAAQGCWLTAGCQTPVLTLLQVLLVVPRLLLFGHEFLHCSGAEHGTDSNGAGETSPSVCVCMCLSLFSRQEQWSSVRQRRLLQGGAASAPAGRGELLLSVGASSTCFLLCFIRSLPPFSSKHRLV